MREPAERLRDILEALSNIRRYSDRSRESFDQDELLQNYFLRQLQIIGEAAGALPAEVCDQEPEVPWREIVGMRNVLVHGYFAVDKDVVWEAVHTHAPALREPIQRLLTRLEGTPQDNR